MTLYRDSQGHPINRGDLVRVLGWDMTFEVVSFRPEGVALIRNPAPGYSGTSTVPLSSITLAPTTPADQALRDLRARLSQPSEEVEPRSYDPRQPRLHSVRKAEPVADLGDVASGRVPLPARSPLAKATDIIERHIEGTFKRRDRAEGAAKDLLHTGLLKDSTERPPRGDIRKLAAAVLQARYAWPVAEDIAASLAVAGLLKRGAR